MTRRRDDPVRALPAAEPGGRWAWRLRPDIVATSLPSRTPGAYLLLAAGRPVYVGRSDTCLRTRLSRHPLRGRATHFLAEPAGPRGAWLRESYWWHRYRTAGTPLINAIHPAARDGAACPFCPYTAPGRTPR